MNARVTPRFEGSSRLNPTVIAIGVAVMAALTRWWGGLVIPPDGEYRPGYLVVLVALIAPGLVGGTVAGLLARHRRQTHGTLAGLGMFVLEIAIGAVGGDLEIGRTLVRALGYGFGAVWGGFAAARLGARFGALRPPAPDPVASVDPSSTLLEVENLTMSYRVKRGRVQAVDGLSFELRRGQSIGLVGESGCGKTSVALSLLRLIPDNGEITEGSIRLGGVDLLGLSEEEMRSRRWSEVAMVFQGAMNAWNPVYTIYEQIREAMDAHFGATRDEEAIKSRVNEVFELVGLDPEAAGRFPHELSGGMRQRAVIAMALSCDPKLIIADEPTTALDVIVQDQILRELRGIQSALGMSIIYISHDIAVIAEATDTIGVMYAGRLVELGPTEAVFADPHHPYTRLLLGSTPSVVGPRRPIAFLDGEPPDLTDPPPGCRFRARCPYATDRCWTDDPALQSIGGQDGRSVACWNWTEISSAVSARPGP